MFMYSYRKVRVDKHQHFTQWSITLLKLTKKISEVLNQLASIAYKEGFGFCFPFQKGYIRISHKYGRLCKCI